MLLDFSLTYTSGYRFGFNGKEKDNEVKGEGNQYDYGMRIYDPRLGKFLSVDPLTCEYPFWTPFQFSGNNPIQFIDPDGNEVLFPLFGLSNTPIIEAISKASVDNALKTTSEIAAKVSENAIKVSETEAKIAETNKVKINQEAIRNERAIETEQLKKLGLDKNTESYTVKDPKTGKDITTIPDGMIPNGQSVEVKSGSSKQSLTEQLRGQEEIAKNNGQKPQLILQEGKPTSKPLSKSSFEIIRFVPDIAKLEHTTVTPAYNSIFTPASPPPIGTINL